MVTRRKKTGRRNYVQDFEVLKENSLYVREACLLNKWQGAKLTKLIEEKYRDDSFTWFLYFALWSSGAFQFFREETSHYPTIPLYQF